MTRSTNQLVLTARRRTSLIDRMEGLIERIAESMDATVAKGDPPTL